MFVWLGFVFFFNSGYPFSFTLTLFAGIPSQPDLIIFSPRCRRAGLGPGLERPRVAAAAGAEPGLTSRPGMLRPSAGIPALHQMRADVAKSAPKHRSFFSFFFFLFKKSLLFFIVSAVPRFARFSPREVRKENYSRA